MPQPADAGRQDQDLIDLKGSGRFLKSKNNNAGGGGRHHQIVMARCRSIATTVLVVWLTWPERGLAANRGQPAGTAERRANDVLEAYLHGTRTGASAQEEPVEFEIEASLPRLKRHGVMRGWKVIAAAGRVAYTKLQFAGDELVRTAVIARFLKADSEQAASGEDIAISKRSYRFRYSRYCDYAGRTAVVFRAEPKRRGIGLFRGEVWIDSDTARPLRDCGEFVKAPSVFLSRIHFVRDYDWSSPEPRPRRIILTMNAAFAGPVELTVWLNQPLPDSGRPTSPPE